jgi:hypothetical protein
MLDRRLQSFSLLWTYAAKRGAANFAQSFARFRTRNFARFRRGKSLKVTVCVICLHIEKILIHSREHTICPDLVDCAKMYIR